MQGVGAGLTELLTLRTVLLLDSLIDRVAAVLSGHLRVVEGVCGTTLPRTIHEDERLSGRKVDRRRIRVRSSLRARIA
jgi:hypothetical protein